MANVYKSISKTELKSNLLNKISISESDKTQVNNIIQQFITLLKSKHS